PRGSDGGEARAGDVRLEHAASARARPHRCAAGVAEGVGGERPCGRPRRRDDGGALRRYRAPARGDEGGMSAELALSCTGLGKRYGSRWALRDCTLEI